MTVYVELYYPMGVPILYLKYMILLQKIKPFVKILWSAEIRPIMSRFIFSNVQTTSTNIYIEPEGGPKAAREHGKLKPESRWFITAELIKLSCRLLVSVGL
jgi:hypothetical protein